MVESAGRPVGRNVTTLAPDNAPPQSGSELTDQTRQAVDEYLKGCEQEAGRVPVPDCQSAFPPGSGIELSGPVPFPSVPWHGAQLDRYSALPASTSSARPEAFRPIITLTMSHFAAALCIANSERGLPVAPSRSTMT